MHLFVTGTDTDVGKTHIAAAIASGLLQLGQKTAYWKPVQTGGSSVDRDAVRALLEQNPKSASKEFAEIPEFASYELAASPDQAAKHASLPEVDVTGMQRATQSLLRDMNQQNLIIEGAGGLLVPIANTFTWSNYLEAWDDCIVVVARTGLGTLNHTLLTVKALAERGHQNIALVLNGPKHAANEQTLADTLGAVCGLQVPFFHFPQTESKQGFCQSSFELVSWLIEQDSVMQAKQSKESNLAESLDRQHCWHPYTQHRSYNSPSGQKMFVESAKDNRIKVRGHGWVLDGIGSWWSCLIGHGRPEIGAAIAKQQAELDHVLYASTAHSPAAQLSQKILDFAQQPQFKKVFYSDNGSTAVEVALKMAFQSRRRSGFENAHRFISLNGSYHGDTIGTMAVGGSAEFHADFEPLLFKPLLIEPVLQDADKSVLEKRLSEFDALLAGRSDEIAGLVVEPLVQGAAGMWMHDPVWLRAICSKAREHKIPVVFDEVFTGMGRLGTPFAAQRLGFAPDLLCLAKGLTAGAASMALTLATKAIFDCFDGDDASSAFLHGHTFTGHAVACAASLASLRVYDQENLVGKAAELESCYLDWIQKNQSKDCIQNARACGSVLAFEVSRAGDAAGSGYFSDPRQKQKLMQAGLESGLFLRPLGATVYLTPPLSVNPEELLLRLDQSIERYLKT